MIYVFLLIKEIEKLYMLKKNKDNKLNIKNDKKCPESVK
jgi:hypothetical protein